MKKYIDDMIMLNFIFCIIMNDKPILAASNKQLSQI